MMIDAFSDQMGAALSKVTAERRLDIHHRNIKIGTHSIRLLSSRRFETIRAGSTKIVYPISEHNLITEILRKQLRPGTVLLQEIKSSLSSGPVIIETTEMIGVVTSVLETLYWHERKGEVVISESAFNIARHCELPLDDTAIARQLLVGLPQYPFLIPSMWKGVQAVHPYAALCYDQKGRVETPFVWLEPTAPDDEELTVLIRQRLIDIVSTTIKNSEVVSGDLSGGIDSAVLAYLVRALGAEIALFHAKSDSRWNSDTNFAERIANDLHKTIVSLPSIAETGQSFTVHSKWAVMPDFPVNWSDTFGYVEEAARYLSVGRISTHLIGLGGDELFAPLPAAEWSMAHLHPWRSVQIAIAYSRFGHRNIWPTLRSITSRQTFAAEMEKRLKSMPNTLPSRDDFSWSEPIITPPALTEKSITLAIHSGRMILQSWSEPLSRDRSIHQMMESLLIQGRIVSQINQFFGSSQLCWVAPYLDSQLIRFISVIPAARRQGVNINKPILASACRGIVPMQVFKREVKGDYSASIHKAYRARTHDLLDMASDGELVKRGFIEVYS